MVAAEGYEVTVTATETVAAAQPLQKHRLPLSNLDLLLPPLAVGVFFCYRRRPARGSAAEVLRAALAKVLVSYYPLAGEVVANAAGEPELLCNNRGVDFIVASATGTALQELSLGEPDESVEGKLVPEKKAGVLCVQVHNWLLPEHTDYGRFTQPPRNSMYGLGRCFHASIPCISICNSHAPSCVVHAGTSMRSSHGLPAHSPLRSLLNDIFAIRQSLHEIGDLISDTIFQPTTSLIARRGDIDHMSATSAI